MDITIRGKELEEYKSLEEAMNDFKETVKGYPNEGLFYAYTNMTVEEFKDEIEQEWNKIHKVNRQENQNSIVNNTDKVNKEEQKIDNKSPQKDDIVRILVEPFKDKIFKVIDSSYELQTVLCQAGDELENVLRYHWEDVEVVEEEWKDIIVEGYGYKYKIEKDRVYLVTITRDINLAFTQKEVDFIIKKYKENNNKQKIINICNTKRRLINRQETFVKYKKKFEETQKNFNIMQSEIIKNTNRLNKFFREEEAI